MARNLWFSYSVHTLGDDGEALDDGIGMGSRISLRYDNGEWRSDESLIADATLYAEYMAEDLIRRRDREVELDRIAAEPFWKRWLG